MIQHGPVTIARPYAAFMTRCGLGAIDAAQLVRDAIVKMGWLGLTRFRGHSDRSLLMEGQEVVPVSGGTPRSGVA